MKLDYRIVCMTLAMCGFSASALAQDEVAADPAATDPAADPTAGDVGGGDMGGGDMGGDASAEGDLAPTDDSGGGGADKPVSVKLLLGYGLSLEDGPNPWSLGFGLGGGYNLDQIYLGARFVYYLGESEDITVPFAGTIETSINLWELGIEGGYDVDLGGAVLRPGLGLGLASVGAEAGGVSNSEMYLYIAPGVGAQFDVSDSIFLGAEARFKMVFGDPDMVKGLVLLASGGMRF